MEARFCGCLFPRWCPRGPRRSHLEMPPDTQVPRVEGDRGPGKGKFCTHRLFGTRSRKTQVFSNPCGGCPRVRRGEGGAGAGLVEGGASSNSPTNPGGAGPAASEVTGQAGWAGRVLTGG